MSTTTRWCGGCPGGAPARSAVTSGTWSSTRRASRTSATGAAASCSSATTTASRRSVTVRHRLEVYADQTAPLIDYYRDNGQLVAIDALGAVEDVTERAIAALTPYG